MTDPAAVIAARPLTPPELEGLRLRGCTVDPGATIRIGAGIGFDPGVFSRVRFEGATLIAGMPARVTDSTLRDVELHRGVTVTASTVTNYRLLEGSAVERVLDMRYDPAAACHTIATLCEAGGINVVSRPGLTVGQAEDEAFHGAAALPYTPEKGIVGERSRLDGCARLEGVITGPDAFAGTAVIAVNTVIDSHARVTDAAMLFNCHVGRHCRIGKGFTTHDSLFFDHCHMECGEADAVFAGPHAVSCHKSTLLIGCRCSFFNAGSGTNMSNHGYRLGPLYWGTLGHGCKTASNAYIMWPATFGAFSLITGEQKHHPDTSSLPFSYIIGDTIVPGVVLKSAGLQRDIIKWTRRSGDDNINCRAMTPEIAEVVTRGYELLRDMAFDTIWQGYRLSAAAAAKGADLYRMALNIFWLTPLVESIARGGRDTAPGFARWWGKEGPELTDAELIQAVETWRDDTLTMLRHAKSDAMRDFIPSTAMSLGDPETHPLLASLEARMEHTAALAGEALHMLR